MNSNVAKNVPEVEARETLWFVARGAVLKGPFTTEQLQAKVKAREIHFLDFCWRQGFKEWRPITSIEELDRRGKLRAVPQYPTVDVPGTSSSPEPTVPENLPLLKSLRLNKVVPASTPSKRFEITFARVKRHSISIYEWGFAMIFAVVLSYFAMDFALTEVENNFTRHVTVLTVGIPQEAGAALDPVSPEAWEPLHSAPGYLDTVEPIHQPAFLIPVGMQTPAPLPVVKEGHLKKASDGTYMLGDHQVIFGLPKAPVWQDESLDPIYYKPTIVRGYLDGHHPKRLRVDFMGEPNLP